MKANGDVQTELYSFYINGPNYKQISFISSKCSLGQTVGYIFVAQHLKMKRSIAEVFVTLSFVE